ncbi:hypothetical protein L3N51_00398 [Metallosphaera sp. J1]|uniref:sodium:calcium antiporter n=1 Tax=Metallosphaera javensis (ex Hofmann et al. 2022) TaxID=99938 RepID=UPI001EDCFB9E|nr:sodium:calcium antiporter [Metallosphaera javensis (ex Hofmann et al. 2022)]MCG3108117.1 hypothetical protein [Metallosphaera javensis (ex Hofmann et al. 2022)]
MELSYLLLQFLLVLFLMLLSAELLSRGVEDLERVMGQGLAGGVILGTLTALPETLIVLVAVLEHKGGIALGSAVGGNVVLFTLGLGLVAIAYHLKWGKSLTMKGDYKRELLVMTLASIILVVSLALGDLNPLFSAVLFSIYVYYVASRIRRGTRGKINVKSVMEVLVGGGIVVVLSPYFVNLISDIATYSGISQTWISLALTPVVAELEEGMSALRIALRYPAGGSTAVVSYFGSKIQNATFLLGLVGLDFVDVRGPFLLLALISNLIGIAIVRDGKLTFAEGLILSVLYFVMLYVAFIFQFSSI